MLFIIPLIRTRNGHDVIFSKRFCSHLAVWAGRRSSAIYWIFRAFSRAGRKNSFSKLQTLGLTINICEAAPKPTLFLFPTRVNMKNIYAAAAENLFHLRCKLNPKAASFENRQFRKLRMYVRGLFYEINAYSTGKMAVETLYVPTH